MRARKIKLKKFRRSKKNKKKLREKGNERRKMANRFVQMNRSKSTQVVRNSFLYIHHTEIYKQF